MKLTSAIIVMSLVTPAYAQSDDDVQYQLQQQRDRIDELENQLRNQEYDRQWDEWYDNSVRAQQENDRIIRGY